ncbi:hypothetical protein, partial [Rhodovulum adriaticum]|uniref:hypothetical protein n=1 Tax=Rhodovulum adriaticum TaxID=35804 RepID=UPI0019050A78
NKGERVRSKSEKILADIFYSKGIDYKYECPVNLSNSVRIYPDFTFLHPTSKKEIYWEHHGMMDDPAYSEETIRKIRTYEKNGIFVGKNLIITFETRSQTLDGEWVEKLIKEHLL